VDADVLDPHRIHAVLQQISVERRAFVAFDRAARDRMSEGAGRNEVQREHAAVEQVIPRRAGQIGRQVERGVGQLREGFERDRVDH
jgi:hypothetical protein